MGWEGGVGRGVGLEGAGGDTGGEGLWDAGREVGAQGWKKGAGGERAAAVLTLRLPPPFRTPNRGLKARTAAFVSVGIKPRMRALPFLLRRRE